MIRLQDVVAVCLLSLPLYAAGAPTDTCWREAYPQLPAQWASYGSVVEAGNRFQRVGGATIELWSVSSDYGDAQRKWANHQAPEATLVRTVTSDPQGVFQLGTIPPGLYEMRAHMEGREMAGAFINSNGAGPQWLGRGLKVALSTKNRGCSRIYSAGLDDTDCGPLDCDRLPAGKIRIIYAAETPLSGAQLIFHSHTKGRGAVELTLLTDVDGFADASSANGCYDISVETPRPRSMHLCFLQPAAPAEVTVVLPPEEKP